VDETAHRRSERNRREACYQGCVCGSVPLTLTEALCARQRLTLEVEPMSIERALVVAILVILVVWLARTLIV
jgi:hypothetical protein